MNKFPMACIVMLSDFHPTLAPLLSHTIITSLTLILSYRRFPKITLTVNFHSPSNFCQILNNTSLCTRPPLPSRKDLSFASKPTAKHAPSTSTPNHSLVLTPTYPILTALLMNVNPLTWCSVSSVWNVMLFYIGKTDQMLWKYLLGYRSSLYYCELSLICTYEVPHCGAFSTSNSHPAWAQIFTSGSCYQIPLAWISPLMKEEFLSPWHGESPVLRMGE